MWELNIILCVRDKTNVINQFNIELLFQLRELYIKYSILLG